MADRQTETPLLQEGMKSKGSEKKTSPYTVAAVVIGILLGVGLIAVTAVLVYIYWPRDPTTDYGVIIDAGSSASRIYVYRWPHRKDKSTVPHVEPVLPSSSSGAKKTDDDYVPLQITQLRLPVSSDLSNTQKPGIAKKKPSEIKEYLKPLLDYAYALVPDKDRARTPIFLFATAGMRILSKDDQEAILKEVRKTFSNCDFNFTYEDDWARVITGSEEGVYGWVTANYLKSILFEDDAKKHVVGALDLGGVSMQITFLPKEKPKANLLTLELPNNDFDLYTYSFLKFGQDAMTKALMNLTAFYQNQTSGELPDRIPFPCYLVGYEEVNLLDIDGKNHTMVGSGDYDLCSQYELEIMDKNATCPVEPCSFDGIYQPELVGDFYAMSGFFYTANFFGFANETNKSSVELYQTNGRQYCAKTWDQVKKEYPSVSESNLRIYCLTSSYMYNILVEGYGFDAVNSNIYFTDQINGTTLGWALGGLIAEASLLPK